MNLGFSKTSTLLLFAFIISPFTQLRFAFLGLGELMILVALLVNLRNYFLCPISELAKFRITMFWLIFLIIQIIGYSYNVMFLGGIYLLNEKSAFDFFAYILLTIFVFVFEYEIRVRKLNIYLFLKTYFFIMGSLITMLYFFSLFIDNILFFQLRYFGSFSPGVENVHQIAMIMMLLPLLGILVLHNTNKIYKKFFIVFLISVLFASVIETNASKAILGMGLGILLYLLFNVLRIRSADSMFIFVLTLILVAVFFISYYFYEVQLLFKAADSNDARAILYASGLSIYYQYLPLFGFGPGPHIPFDSTLYDAHQTLLTILLQSGVIGLLLFLVLLISIFYRALKYPLVFTIFIAVLVYIVGGDVLRRLTIWFFIVCIYYYKGMVWVPYEKRTL